MDVIPLMVIAVVLFTSFWVFIDATKMGFGGMKPLGWLVACLLLWIIAFPYYLIVRDRLKRAQQRCLECGGVVPDGVQKCMHCGSAVERSFDVRCPACGEIGKLRESNMTEEIECPKCKRVFLAASARV